MKLISDITALQKGDYIYTKKKKDNMHIYFIGIVKSIKDNNVTLSVSHHMTSPENDEMKAFLYDELDETITYDSEMYVMNATEWTTTYINFIKNDGRLVKELPKKLIMDTIII